MTDHATGLQHDPLCPVASPLHGNWCQCELIAKVRADERERSPVVYERDLAPLADLRAKVEALDTDEDSDGRVVGCLRRRARPDRHDEDGPRRRNMELSEEVLTKIGDAIRADERNSTATWIEMLAEGRHWDEQTVSDIAHWLRREQ